MKYLTLIRHAKSTWGDFRLSDFERPLCESERRVVPVVGKYFRQTYLEASSSGSTPFPQKVFSSTALRAKGTAQILIGELQRDTCPIQYEEVEKFYDAPAIDYLHLIRDVHDELEHVVVIGHNPGLSTFASELVKDDEVEELATCAGVILKISTSAWRELNWNEAELVGKFSPRLVEKRWKLDLTASQF